MKVHELKIAPRFFDPLVQGMKTAEYRKDDCGFQEGDILHLKEWDLLKKDYTGREALALVQHVLGGLDAIDVGVPEGYCVMSVRAITARMPQTPGTDQARLPSQPLNFGRLR